MCPPFAGPYLFNFEVSFYFEKWVNMTIHKFKQEQFDDANELVTNSSSNVLRMCADALLDLSCWIVEHILPSENLLMMHIQDIKLEAINVTDNLQSFGGIVEKFHTEQLNELVQQFGI